MIAFLLGGARSGKSAVAEDMARSLKQPVTYMATLNVGDDADLAARVERHRARRPAGWRTIEVGRDLPEVLSGTEGSVLVDSLGPWVARSRSLEADVAALCSALQERRGDAVVVSEEVGLSVHPSTEVGRRFQDALGTLNQAVAACADEVVLVVAGRTLALVPPARG